MSLRVLFAGTPEFALPSFHACLESAAVVAVLTAPDAPKGRGRRPAQPPVKVAADKAGVPVLQPQRLGADARAAVAEYRPDLLVCAAYGRIFGPRFLSLFSKGGINVHPSLLPRHRGPTPVQATILAGDEEAGVTIQRLALKLDSGDILSQASLSLRGDEHSPKLESTLAEMGARLLGPVLRDIEAGREAGRPQDEDTVTYCAMIEKEDGRIDWSLPAATIDRMARAYDPWPGVYTYWNGERLVIKELSIVEAETFVGSTGPGEATRPEDRPAPGCVVGVDKGIGILVQTGQHWAALRRLQPAGRRAMDYLAFANGSPGIRDACFE